jgi:hypothetical protein
MADSQISTDIGTELLFENDRIRVWQMILAPGEESHLHRHVHDYVYVYTTPSHITAFYDGKGSAGAAYEDGFVQYTAVGTDMVPHKIRNTGDDVHRQILVEFKGPSETETVQTPQNNGRKHS